MNVSVYFELTYYLAIVYATYTLSQRLKGQERSGLSWDSLWHTHSSDMHPPLRSYLQIEASHSPSLDIRLQLLCV